MKKFGSALKALLVPWLIIGISVFMLAHPALSAESLRSYVSGFGALAPIAYLFMWLIMPIGFFPVPVLAIAGGLAFGIPFGSLLTILGAMGNSSIMYWMGRFWMRDRVIAWIHKNESRAYVRWLEQLSGPKGFVALLVLRLTPLVPYNLINYASGLIGISFLNYSLATFIGIIPATFVFLNMGSSLVEPGSPAFWVALALLVILVIGSAWLAKRYGGEKKL